MHIDVRHIPLEKESVLDRLLTPVIISDPLPGFSNLASNACIPVIDVVPQTYVLNRIPEVLTKSGVTKKAPVLVRWQ
jgi:hypothetical protein